MIEQLLEHSGWARRLARGLLRDASRADDAVQEAWVAALSRSPAHSTNLGSWFGFLVRRAARRSTRADERRAHRELSAAKPEALAASDALERAELQRALVEAVLALDDPYRTAIVLAYFEDLRPQEIARRLGIEPSTARSHIHRGLAKLRADLERRGRGREDFLPAIAALAQGGTGLLSWPTRGLIMTTKAKVAAAAVVLLAAGSWVWWHAESAAVGQEGSASKPAATAERASSSAPSMQQPNGESERSAVAAESAPAATTPSSVEDSDDAELLVRVVDAKAAPVAEASVEVLRSEARPYSFLQDLEYHNRETPIAAGKSDARGEISFRLPRGRPHDLRVRSEPFAERQLTGVHAGETAVVALRPGVSLSGIVRRAPEGAPIDGVELVLTSEEGFAPMWEGRTDAGGHYLARGLDPGRAYLMVIPEDERPANADLELKEGESNVRDFDLAPGTVLEGEVRDRATRLPIEGAEVSSWSFLHKIARTDSSGKFVLRGVREGAYVEIQCRARGYGRSEAKVAAQVGSPLHADFELSPSRTVRGRVVSRSGEPIEGVYVSAVASRFDRELKLSRGDCPSARTGDDGRFAIAELRADSPHALFLRKEGFATTIVDLSEKESSGPVVDTGDVILPGMSSLSGEIVDADGAGIEDAGIEIQLERPDAAVDLTGIAMQQTQTGADGRFRIVDLAAGKHRLRVYRTGLPAIEKLEVELKEGEARRGFVIRMGGTLRIAGRVLDPDGAPAPNARVYVRGGNLSPSSWHSAVADSSGAFVFAGLDPGEYSVNAEPEYGGPGERPDRWFGSKAESVRAGSEDVVLTLQRRASIAGRIVAPEAGAPARAWIVAVDAAGSRVSWAASAADGSFLLDAGAGTEVELRVWVAKPDPQSYWGFSADESTPPIAVRSKVQAGTKDLSIEVPR